MDDFVFIKLRCADCEATPQECSLYPHGLIPKGEEGCTRKVTEKEQDQMKHYLEEVLPFVRTYKNIETRKQTYQEIIDFMFYLTTCPLGQKLNYEGKAVTQT